MQRILFVSPFMYPEPISTARYNTHLVDALHRAGAQTEVVCSQPLYPDWRPRRSDASMPGITFRRGGGWLRYPKAPLVRRAVLELWFAAHAAVAWMRARRRTDLIVAVMPPSLFALALAIMAGDRVPIVAIVHDLQARYAARRSGLGRRLIGRAIRWVEQRVLQRAARIIAASHAMGRELVRDYGLPADRVRVHYPFVTLGGELSPSAETQRALSALFARASGERHVVYAGALGEKQNPEQLCDLILKLVDEMPALHFHVRSGGPAFEKLRSHAVVASHPRIHCSALVSEQLLPFLYLHADLNVVPQALGSSDASLPSKLPNILACRGRVLAIGDADSEALALVREFDAGLTVATWDVAALSAQIASYLSSTPPRRLPLGAVITLDPKALAMFGLDRLVRDVLLQDEHPR